MAVGPRRRPLPKSGCLCRNRVSGRRRRVAIRVTLDVTRVTVFGIRLHRAVRRRHRAIQASRDHREDESRQKSRKAEAEKNSGRSVLELRRRRLRRRGLRVGPAFVDGETG